MIKENILKITDIIDSTNSVFINKNEVVAINFVQGNLKIHSEKILNSQR